MAEAAARVRAGEVTQAVRDSVAECGPIANGDWIAITRDGIQVAVKSAVDAAVALVDVLVDDDAELVTVIVGQDADADDTARLGDHLADAHPHVEVEVHRRWPAALPVPHRRRVAQCGRPPGAQAGLTLRELASHRVTELRAVGDKLRAGLAEMGIETVLDLLEHYPRRYVDRTERAEIHELEIGEEATVDAEVQVGPRPAHARPQAHHRRTRPSTTAPACSRSCSSTRRGANGSCGRARRSRCSARSRATGASAR